MPFLTLLAITLISLSVVSRATCFIIGRKQGVDENCYPKNQSLDHNPTSRLRKLKANPEPWSCIATLDSERDGEDVGIQFVGNSEISSQNGMRYSLSSPREWMEAIEAQHGCHGAYTNTNHPNDILVRGHAFCTNLSSIPTEYDPIPTMATIAIPKNESTQLPSRYNHMPKAKLSSWCSERRPIEQEFKIPDTVYSDGTIRTPSDAVLDGFARQLVMASAERHGLQVSNDPITLEDAKNGLWAEVFLTSSIRIIIPVGNVMIPDYTKEGEVTFKQIWSESPLSTIPWKLRRWKLLYEDIIHFINIP
eukprot:scaffold1980_cov228-Chaetoceros_neogracile.AAC.2